MNLQPVQLFYYNPNPVKLFWYHIASYYSNPVLLFCIPMCWLIVIRCIVVIKYSCQCHTSIVRFFCVVQIIEENELFEKSLRKYTLTSIAVWTCSVQFLKYFKMNGCLSWYHALCVVLVSWLFPHYLDCSLWYLDCVFLMVSWLFFVVSWLCVPNGILIVLHGILNVCSSRCLDCVFLMVSWLFSTVS